ncbi:MAG TPA: hypothetical protein VHZ33_35290 [Trebonia sp.]|jgi:hypothetical protein|nr:hypothetical protein [Trebonia sp.]
MDELADQSDEDRDRALRRRRFLRVSGEVVLAFGAGGLLTGCNFSHGSGNGESTTTAPATDGTKGSANPLSGSSGNSSS